MHKFIVFSTLILTVLLTGCPPSERIIPPDTECKNMEIVNFLGSSGGGRSFTIQSAVVEEHNLRLEVSYNCGCGESAFALQGKADFAESLPVQTAISLILRGNDNCEAACPATLCFDLTPLIEKYKDTYPPGDGDTLNLNLEDFGEMISVGI
jgi:hypothetical protein